MSLARWEMTMEKGKLNMMSTIKLAYAKNLTSLNCFPFVSVFLFRSDIYSFNGSAAPVSFLPTFLPGYEISAILSIQTERSQ
jgi:hypothetical protein